MGLSLSVNIFTSQRLEVSFFRSFKRPESEHHRKLFSDSGDAGSGSIHVVSIISIVHHKMTRWHLEKSTGLAVRIAQPDPTFIVYKHPTL